MVLPAGPAAVEVAGGALEGDRVLRLAAGARQACGKGAAVSATGPLPGLPPRCGRPASLALRAAEGRLLRVSPGVSHEGTGHSSESACLAQLCSPPLPELRGASGVTAWGTLPGLSAPGAGLGGAVGLPSWGPSGSVLTPGAGQPLRSAHSCRKRCLWCGRTNMPNPTDSGAQARPRRPRCPPPAPQAPVGHLLCSRGKSSGLAVVSAANTATIFSKSSSRL